MIGWPALSQQDIARCEEGFARKYQHLGGLTLPDATDIVRRAQLDPSWAKHLVRLSTPMDEPPPRGAPDAVIRDYRSFTVFMYLVKMCRDARDAPPTLPRPARARILAGLPPYDPDAPPPPPPAPSRSTNISQPRYEGGSGGFGDKTTRGRGPRAAAGARALPSEASPTVPMSLVVTYHTTKHWSTGRDDAPGPVRLVRAPVVAVVVLRPRGATLAWTPRPWSVSAALLGAPKKRPSTPSSGPTATSRPRLT